MLMMMTLLEHWNLNIVHSNPKSIKMINMNTVFFFFIQFINRFQLPIILGDSISNFRQFIFKHVL